MHKTIYDISAKRAQYKIENHTHKKDIYNKKRERNKQTNQKQQEQSQNPTNSLNFMEMYENKHLIMIQ